MSSKKTDIDELLRSESDAIEANPDAPLTSETKVTRGHDRVKKLQIRLSEEEYRQVERAAEARGIPASTMARSLLLAEIDKTRREVPRTQDPTRSAYYHVLLDEIRSGLRRSAGNFSLFEGGAVRHAEMGKLLAEMFGHIEIRLIGRDLPLSITYSADAVSTVPVSRPE